MGLEAAPAPAERVHVRYLDGLRGIAILMVVMVHASQLVVGLAQPLRDLTFYGVRGVQLFFIVSGLTLTLAHVRRPLEPANFAARRFFRIAPMFYLGALLYLVLGSTTALRFAPHDWTWGEVLATLAFVHRWSVGANNKIVPGGWSIGAEAMFYLVFPALLMQARARPRLLGLLALASYGVAGAANLAIRRFLPGDPDLVHGFAFSFWLCQLPAFASGCWLATEAGRPRLGRRGAALLALVAAAAILVDTQARGHSNLLVSIALLALLVWALGQARPRWLEGRFLPFLGEVSFSLYLLHFAVLGALVPVAPALEAWLGAPAAFLLVYAATLALAVPSATLTYRWVELPAIRFARPLFRRPAPAGM